MGKKKQHRARQEVDAFPLPAFADLRGVEPELLSVIRLYCGTCALPVFSTRMSPKGGQSSLSVMSQREKVPHN